MGMAQLPEMRSGVMTSVELILGQLYQLVGNAVLLPLPFGEKRPVVPGWQTTTYQASMEPAYQRWLKAAIDRNGNVGVLLGTVSDHLCAIDIDNDNRVEPFLALNPALCDTLRTRGRRGCQIWIRVSGEYPAKVHKLRALDGTKPNDKGARFQTNFEKQRNSDSREWTREWTFQTESDGQISIGCTEISFDGKVLQLIQAGLSSASDIAEELNVAKSTVSKAAQRLLDKKLIETSGRQYKPRGFMKETKTP
jgi:hypothetical protein